jgi:pimeloyl-ACP methyl ester carboxylesterase
MIPAINGELVRVFTEDRLELNGLYQPGGTRDMGRGTRGAAPNPRSLTPGPLSVVHVHGWDGNFYENRFIDHAARVCAEQGIGFVSGNNRGHDYTADILRSRRNQKSETRNQNAELADPDLTTKTLRHQDDVRRDQKSEDRSQKAKAKCQKAKPTGRLDYVQIGGMYEKLTDCVPDVRAWVDFAIGRGAKRIILQGHSHGAIKVVHYLVTTRDPRVCGLVLLSPSDDMGISRKQLGDRFLWVLARARELVRAGKGRQLMPERDSQYPVSAATFFDCYNKGSITGIFNMSRTDRNEFPEIASISVPVLTAVGTVEEAFVGAPRKYVEDIRTCMVNCPSFTGAVIEGAPHNYLGREAELAGVLEKWLRQRTKDGQTRSQKPETRDQNADRIPTTKTQRHQGSGHSISRSLDPFGFHHQDTKAPR